MAGNPTANKQMSEAVKYNRSMELPQDNYILRVLDEGFAPSKSSGNPMITLETEVHSPSEIEIAGQPVTVAGLKIKRYLPTQVIENGELNIDKTQKAAKRLETEYKLFGLSFDGFNPENPTLGFKGKLVHARLYSKKTEQRKAPTAEQRAAGKLGDVIVNPITNQPVVNYEPQIAEIYGIAQGGAGGVF